MTRHLAANAITLLIIVLVLFLGLIRWGQEAYRGPGPLEEARIIEIPRGANLARATDRLMDAGAIAHATVFRIGARYAGKDDQLKQGCFTVPERATMQEILDLITSSGGAQTCYQVALRINNRGIEGQILDARAEDQAQREWLPLEEVATRFAEQAEAGGDAGFRLTVAEGLTVREVLAGLNAVPYLDGSLEDVPSEGMLAPDSYEFSRGGSRAALVARMFEEQQERLAQAWESRDPELPLASPEELLTLASIVEKETAVPSEREEVASVFVSRLERGMRLQTDPTIIYGVTRGVEPFDREIRRSDIDGVTERREHGDIAYNTYQIDGLPAGPIANPGRASLMAAANPADTPYLYFVADGSGGHAFAETLEEHNRNVAAYRRLLETQ